MTDTTLTAPTARRRHPLRLALMLATALLLIGAATAAAAPNPTSNITPGPLPRVCNRAPHGATCINAEIGVLNAARADLGLGPYVVPADFASLTGAQQLLILCNLDRLAYGLPPIAGLSPALNTVAAGGVTADNDPDPSALLTSIPVFGWTSNWAGAYPNAPEAYYAWMYSDGWSGNQTSNLDCTSATASGCWGHRQDVLAFSAAGCSRWAPSWQGRARRGRLRDDAGLDPRPDEPLGDLQLQLGAGAGRRRRRTRTARLRRAAHEAPRRPRRLSQARRRRPVTSGRARAVRRAGRRSRHGGELLLRRSGPAPHGGVRARLLRRCARPGSRPRRLAGR